MTSQRSLSTQWVQHIRDPKEKERVLKLLKSESTHILILNQILENRLQALEKESLSQSSYESPSWAYKQADLVGSIRELKKVLELIAPMTEGNS